MATFRSASSLAFSDKVVWRRTAFATATRFQSVKAVPAQNKAASVWSAVRTELLNSPTVFTSLKSLAYSALVRGGGPAGLKLDGLGITHGSSWACEGSKPLAKPG